MNKITSIMLGLLLLTLFILWVPTRSIPYWWDSAGYIVVGARNLIASNFWPLDVGIPGAYAHPILFPLLIAVLWKVFGESLLLSHLVNLFFSGLLLTYVFLLGRQLTGNKLHGAFIGAIAGMLLLFTPLFYAQLGIIYLEIPATAFAVMTVYYFLKRQFVPYLIASVLMLLIKEVAVFVILVLLFVLTLETLVIPFVKTRKIQLKKWFLACLLWGSPLLAVALWLLYHKLMFGWWLIPPNSESTLTDKREIGPILQQIVRVGTFLFFYQWRFLMTLFFVVILEELLIKEKLRRYFWHPNLLSLILLPIAAIVLFGVTEYLHRYILITLPFFYLLFSYCFITFFKDRSAKTISLIMICCTLIIAFLFSTSWNNKRVINSWHFLPIEDNLEYLDVVDLGRQVSRYLTLYHPDATVLTAFPTNYMLSQPFQHYVKKPFTVVDCNKIKPGTNIDLVVFHLLSPPQRICAQLIRDQKLKLIKTFEKNGKQMGIFIPQYKVIYVDPKDIQ